ncbi:MAG: sulfatase [Candidatus Hydrogenedentota bacterium]|nr:MAG: sulfatase [Candidatus Hydrogenedentota bacterium]
MDNHKLDIDDFALTRRDFLQRTGLGFGAYGLGSLLGGEAFGTETNANVALSPMAPKQPHFPGKAKRVIHIFLNGGLSHVDSFDPKPILDKYHGKKLPMDHLKTERPTGGAFRSPYTFKQYGESGIPVSELFEKTAQHVDDMCIIRSMHADVPNHEPSLMLMNTGEARLIRPSMGAWVTYGLGTENQSLPGFVSMCPDGYPIQESQNWQAGFLPSVYQGTYINTRNTDLEKLIEFIKNKYTSLGDQRKQLDLLVELNRRHQKAREGERDLEARIHSYELAYRMQMEASDAFDISREPKYIRDQYGDSVQSRQLLIARRLLERGVRFVQVWHGQGQPWDHHDDLEKGHRNLAKECDQGIAALLTDLKERGMLEDTLVLCCGEFGRTPTVELPKAGSNQGKINGRDHNHYGFTAWLAGGGVKGGHIHGATDEFGFQAVENRVHVHDLHATMLHLLGFDHEKFTYRYAGRDFRLTDVHGNVVHDIIA